jgi:TPR repeat protein
MICLISLSLFACATKPPPHVISELQQGKRFFDDGYYKRAMHELLPLACDGNPDSQYAVGYMYYYGLGVGQDTDIGYFWIQRAANRNYVPAMKALEMIEAKNAHAAKSWAKLKRQK